ncbi:AMP-binding protein [Rhodococcus hoagii]|nr:AMP-binding protein [Prescottella equi]
MTDGESTLTYRELDERSDASARRMSDEEGIGPEDVVALPPTRSIERVVQLWAVAKTGAAFGEHDHRSPGAVSHSWMLRRPSTRSPTSSRRPAPPAPPSRSP